MFENTNSIKIALDFDGTVVTHEYPKIGQDVGAIPVLRKLIKNGHKLILNTMRSGAELDDAISWFNSRGIELYSIGYDPDQHKWTTSNKCYANLIIDDTSLGIPLKMMVMTNDEDEKISHGRPFVDWKAVEKYLINMGLID